MATKLLELWLGTTVYEPGSYVYVDSSGNVDISNVQKPKKTGTVRFVILSDT